MTISHDGYTFENPITNDTINYGDWEAPLIVNRSFGLKGETHTTGEREGRDITVEVTISGYGTLALLDAATETINSKINKLTGTLTVDGVSLNNCTFRGFAATGNPMLDGSGVNGYRINGNLRWRQRSP